MIEVNYIGKGTMKDSDGLTYTAIGNDHDVAICEDGRKFIMCEFNEYWEPLALIPFTPFPDPEYWNTETGAILTTEDLKQEFENARAEAPEDFEGWTFNDYIREVTGKNGTLEEV